MADNPLEPNPAHEHRIRERAYHFGSRMAAHTAVIRTTGSAPET